MPLFPRIPARLSTLNISNLNLTPSLRTSLHRYHTHSLFSRPNVPITALQFFHARPLQIEAVRISKRFLSEDGKWKPSEEQKKPLREQKLEAHPESVSTTSTIRPIFEAAPQSGDPDMLGGLKSELKTVKDTFALKEVPREVFYLGMAGLTPYVVTSFTTIALAWDMNYAGVSGTGYLLSPATAEYLLHILEPVQVGLGAIILSFLGAVHWGLEMAEYGGRHVYKRYALGVVAPIIAWPTIALPLEYALLTQFMAFTLMYYIDSSVSVRGWAPRWYGLYRFLLTFVVGASIVITLIGRGQIGDRVPGPASYLEELKGSRWEALRKEDFERKRRLNALESAERERQKERTQKAAGGHSPGSSSDHTKSSGKDGKTAADPGKRAKGDNQGKQGIYSDDKQGNSGRLGDTAPYPHAEPTAEKKALQTPMPEGMETAAAKG